VLGAITYPAVILAVAAGMVFTMIVFLVPVFEGVYARANTALPAPTRLLIAVSGVIRGYTLVVITGAVAAAVLLYGSAQSPRGRRLIDGAKLRVPLFGPLVRKAVLARTCRTLSVLLSSGIPLIEAMGTVARVSGNRVIEDALTEATAHVQELVNNILKHSSSSFIHLTQNVHGDKFYLRIHHDGRGIVQADFDKLNKSNVGLGLKNISSRLRVVQGNIVFEKDISQTYYKVTIELPKDEPYQ
jgi:hypothetical protein